MMQDYLESFYSPNMTTPGPGNISSTTENPACTNEIPFYAGFIAAGVAILFFGSNFAPVKKYDTGDGMFFQWVMCIAIWCCGLVVNIVRNSPKFYPLVMLGGFLWETGNICVVPIIKTIGLSLGLCIWGMTNLLSGWATGSFGLFGVNKDPPDNVALNYIGVGLSVSSAFIFSMVKNEISTAGVDHTVTVDVSETSPLLNQTPAHEDMVTTEHTANHDVIVFNKRTASPSINQKTEGTDESDEMFLDKLSPGTKRLVGLILSIVSGVFYGQMFTPALHVQHNVKNASQSGFDYVFATFTGILATSTVYFIIYCILQRNKPKVYPRAILPGFVSGSMWGIATSSWFIANQVLSESVSFPIVTTGPAVIASLLGVLVFHEIKGRRNILILLAGFTVTFTGAILAGLSKKAKSC